jgi:acyl carrier protein
MLDAVITCGKIILPAMSIIATVVDILAEVQEISGRANSTLTGVDKPIGQLDGFDSLTSIEATVMIEAKLGIDAECDSLFISSDGSKALTLDEVVARIESIATAQKKTIA